MHLLVRSWLVSGKEIEKKEMKFLPEQFNQTVDSLIREFKQDKWLLAADSRYREVYICLDDGKAGLLLTFIHNARYPEELIRHQDRRTMKNFNQFAERYGLL